MPIRDNDPRPAYEQVADDLRQAIRAGEYQPGDRLPSTRDLTESYGIAAMTVRNALRVLEEEHLVVARQGRGVFVRTPEAPSPDSLEAVRRTLDSAMTLLQGINDRLDRYEAARDGIDPATVRPRGRVDPDRADALTDPDVQLDLAEAMVDLIAANEALDRVDAFDYDPPMDLGPEPGPELGL